MFTIPARITGIETAAERTRRGYVTSEAAWCGVTVDEMEQMMQAEVEVAADRIKTVADLYSHRGAPAARRGDQDASALYHLLGGLEQYVRDGGDAAVLDAVVRALDHGAAQ